MEKPTVAFHTLGCKLNFAETSTIGRQLQEAGYQKVMYSEKADVYVINTCSVTENADRECKTHVHRALALNPEAFVVVTGCYAQLKPETIAAIPGVGMVLGAKEKFNIAHYLSKRSTFTKGQVFSCNIEELDTFVGSYSAGDRTRVFLKVQDGCDYGCSFCTIPQARGKSRSGNIEQVLIQVNQIIEQGAKEIVLTGVNLGDFGITAGQRQRVTHFYQLMLALEQLPYEIRFRISSIEPNLLTNEIINLVSQSSKFMPHFHIPLQSGSDRILKLMRRRYLTDLYASRISYIKQMMPHACIGADVITGFPGETEEDFLTTYHFLNQSQLSYLHVFTYSERANTPALALKPVVPVNERKKRTHMLRILSEKKLRSFYLQNEGATAQVLFESDNKEGMMHGYTENYIKVKTPYNNQLVNQIVSCHLQLPDEDGEVNCTLLNLQTV
jgi:threonylcarbamoyladenosine tRNA methylthiotransferase MtaB